MVRSVVGCLLGLFLVATALRAEGAVDAAIALNRNGHRDQAILLLEGHLVSHPGDVDALLRYGLFLSWDGRFEEARRVLTDVLSSHPDYADAAVALGNVELWTDNPDRAAEVAMRGLERSAKHPELMMILARAQRANGQHALAIVTVNRILDDTPGRQDAKKLREGIEDEGRQWEVQVDHSYEWFSDGRSAWNETQFSASGLTRYGSLIARYSRADRFSEVGHQAEIDFYPRLRRGTWAYLNAGYSYDAALYPRTRFGADLYQSVGRGFEVSGGFRRLHFSENVTIYTGSLTKYYGNWMFTGRTFLTPDLTGTSRTLQVVIRKYFGSGREYVGVRASRGASPTEIRDLNDIEILNASSFAAEWYKIFGRRWSVNLRAGFSNEERIGRENLYHYLLDGSLYYRF